jgi:hypothetical protein
MYNTTGSVSDDFNKLILLITGVLIIGSVAVLWDLGINGYKTTVTTTSKKISKVTGEVLRSQ